MVHVFGQFASDIRDPSANYFPMVTEVKGVANLMIGSMQLLVSRYMHYRGSAFASLERRHIQHGVQAIRLGAMQFLPGLFMYLIFRNLQNQNF